MIDFDEDDMPQQVTSWWHVVEDPLQAAVLASYQTEYNKKYAEAHAMERKNWQLQNKASQARYSKNWRSANKEHLREYRRQHRQANPEMYREKYRRARERAKLKRASQAQAGHPVQSSVHVAEAESRNIGRNTPSDFAVSSQASV